MSDNNKIPAAGGELVERETTAIATTDFVAGFGTSQGFELLLRVSKMFAASLLVPKVYQGNVANCAIAIELAGRMNASPLMCLQHLNIVHGKPGFSAQFLIAAVNSCGRFSNLQYEFVSAEGSDDWGCTAWATEKATGRRVQGPKCTIRMAKAEGWVNKDGSKWKTMPELMLTYRAAAFFARTNAPELTMGLPTSEELFDTAEKDTGNVTESFLPGYVPRDPMGAMAGGVSGQTNGQKAPEPEGKPPSAARKPRQSPAAGTGDAQASSAAQASALKPSEAAGATPGAQATSEAPAADAGAALAAAAGAFAWSEAGAKYMEQMRLAGDGFVREVAMSEAGDTLPADEAKALQTWYSLLPAV